MNKITKNALQFIIVSFLIAFVLVLISFLIYHGKNLQAEYLQVKSLKNSLLFRESFADTLQALPFIIIFIYILCFSVLFTLRPFQTDSFSYGSVAHPSYILLILFIILIVASEFLIIPKFLKDKVSLDYRLRVAHRAASYVKELRATENYERALSVLNVYLKIDEDNQEMNNLYTEITKTISEQPVVGITEIKKPDIEEEERASYYEKGKAAYEEEKYYSALYYFERALTLHMDNAELKELYKRTKARVENSLGSITRKEEEKKRLIEQKERALGHMKKEEYYDAYYIFSRLSRKYPLMEDLRLYLDAVVQELKKQDFLPAELKEAQWLPSINNIIFIDRGGYVNTVERIIPFMNNFYFYNIKRYQSTKDPISLATWKYGKWIEGKIRLKNDEGFKKIDEKDWERHHIYPYVPPGYLIYHGEREELLGMLNIYERFTLSENLRAGGFDIETKFHYLAKKLGIFSSVYVLTLFLSTLAWAKRSIYEFPPVTKLFLFILVVPFAVYLLHLLYIDMNHLIIYSHRYFTRFMFKNMNVVIFTGIFNLVFSIIATLYFLSQSSRIE